VDNKPVDLFFALLVPEDSTDEHLQLLAQLAEMFSDEGFVAKLRNCHDAPTLLKALQSWQPNS
jgi:PTS system nitrogen regulatory IIA component